MRDENKDNWSQYDWSDAINEEVDKRYAANVNYRAELLDRVARHQARTEVGKEISDIAYKERCERGTKLNQSECETLIGKIMKVLGDYRGK